MKFVVKEYEISTKYSEFYNVIAIGIKDSNGNVFPSPLTNFVKGEYRNKGNSLNSQRNAAYAITRLLNYLGQQVDKGRMGDLKVGGLEKLTLEHGAEYITYLSLRSREGKLDSNYVNGEIKYINKFYYWLKKQNIITQDFVLTYSTLSYGRKNIEVEKNIFETSDIDIILPTKSSINQSKIRDFGKNRSEIVLHFIDIAKKEEPLLALGVALQFFGGLRRSEVVNLKVSSLKWINKSMVAEIRDNQKELFPNVKNTSHLQVKNPRDQVFICQDILKILLDKHLNLFKQKGISNTSALFVSPTTKKVITGKQYSEKFEKIKSHFLNSLLENGHINEYLLLTNNKWATHIGRGVFTNFLIDLGLTATQIALARGDRNIQSSLNYVDEHTMLENVNMAVNNFRTL